MEGLTLEPLNFASTLTEDEQRTDDDWRVRLERNYTFGAFDDKTLVGVATYSIEEGAKTAHRGHVGGVYLRPASRGTGAATQLMQVLVESARHKVRFLYLAVNAANARAIRFYQRIGFAGYGRDPGGLMVDGTIHPDYLMMLSLDEGSRKATGNE